MTDLEITRWCAEAMDFPEDESATRIILYREEGHIWTRHEADAIGKMYHPLHDDAQAMALVKNFQLSVGYNEGWAARRDDWKGLVAGSFHSPDLNRAICECVAKMQNAKTIR